MESDINEIQLKSDRVRNLVKSYLIQKGYSKTLPLFDKSETQNYELDFRSGRFTLILR